MQAYISNITCLYGNPARLCLQIDILLAHLNEYSTVNNPVCLNLNLFTYELMDIIKHG